MPATLTTMRSRLRTDLKDDAAARWADGVLDRHLARTVSEYSLLRPRELRSTIATTAGSRMLDISSLSDVIVIEAIEHPIDLYPRIFAPFTHFAGTCELLVDDKPTGANARVYWHSVHVLTTGTSSIHVEDEEIVLTGAAAYALLEYGQYSVDRVNLGGADVDSEYHAQGRDYMRRYHDMLRELRQRRGVLSSKLFAPAEFWAERDVVVGP
ncbi:MAG: hypothetical protein WEB00_09305 [Dehalococcoidia bacterium]